MQPVEKTILEENKEKFTASSSDMIHLIDMNLMKIFFGSNTFQIITLIPFLKAM